MRCLAPSCVVSRAACALTALWTSAVCAADFLTWNDLVALPPMPPGYRVIDGVVAQVEDRIITLGDVERAAAYNAAHRGLMRQVGHDDGAGTGAAAADTPLLAGPPGGVPATGPARQGAVLLTPEEREAFEAQVNDALALAEADRLGVAATDADVDAWLEGERQRSGLSPEAYREALEASGYSLDTYREVVRRFISKRRAFRYLYPIRVTDFEVRRVMERDYAGGTGQLQVCLHTILVAVPAEATPAAVERAARRARWLRAQLAVAPEYFEDFARRFSDDEDAGSGQCAPDPRRLRTVCHRDARHNGGAFGCVHYGDLPKLFETAVFSTPPGQVGPLVRLPGQGFVLFRVDRYDDIVNLQERIRSERLRQRTALATEQWYRDLRYEHHVRVYLDHAER